MLILQWKIEIVRAYMLTMGATLLLQKIANSFIENKHFSQLSKSVDLVVHVLLSSHKEGLPAATI